MPDPISTDRDTHGRTGIYSDATRILIVANQTASSPTMMAELERRTRYGRVNLHLLVPALNDRVRYWLSDSDEAVEIAHRRAEDARSAMAARGIVATVEIGDSVPIHAIADTLSRFQADEILISTLPPDRSHWLERDLINDSRQRFGLPVTHIVAVQQTAIAA